MQLLEEILMPPKHDFSVVTVDPAFRLMRFPLDGELDFDFEKL